MPFPLWNFDNYLLELLWWKRVINVSGMLLFPEFGNRTWMNPVMSEDSYCLSQVVYIYLLKLFVSCDGSQSFYIKEVLRYWFRDLGIKMLTYSRLLSSTHQLWMTNLSGKKFAEALNLFLEDVADGDQQFRIPTPSGLCQRTPKQQLRRCLL
jgi:hypothetical protein